MTLEQDIQLAELALEAIAKIIETVRSAKAGTINSDDAITQIAALHDALAANNAAADKAVGEKFDTP
jgi:hypothetical protein